MGRGRNVIKEGLVKCAAVSSSAELRGLDDSRNGPDDKGPLWLLRGQPHLIFNQNFPWAARIVSSTISLAVWMITLGCFMMSTCGTCWRVFPAGWRSRKQHMDAVGHNVPDFECDTCDRYFRSQHAVNQHMTDVGHWAESSDSEMPEFECGNCQDAFYAEDDLRDHEVQEHFYCDPCDRHFKNRNSVNQVGLLLCISSSIELIFHSICAASTIPAAPSVALSATILMEMPPA